MTVSSVETEWYARTLDARSLVSEDYTSGHGTRGTQKDIVLSHQETFDNLADLGTKQLDQSTMWKHVRHLSCDSRDGRSKLCVRARCRWSRLFLVPRRLTGVFCWMLTRQPLFVCDTN